MSTFKSVWVLGLVGLMNAAGVLMAAPESAHAQAAEYGIGRRINDSNYSFDAHYSFRLKKMVDYENKKTGKLTFDDGMWTTDLEAAKTVCKKLARKARRNEVVEIYPKGSRERIPCSK